MRHFEPGQRVIATAAYRKQFPGHPTTGVVTRVVCRGATKGHPVVLRDGRRSPQAYGPGFWVPETTLTPDAAERLVNYLFLNGAGEVADRLELKVKTPTGERGAGGWCRRAVLDAIRSHIPVA